MSKLDREQAIAAIVKPVFDAIAKAEPKVSRKDALAIDRATANAARAASRAVQLKRISTTDALNEIPARLGFGMLQALRRRAFASRRDATRLWDLAVDFMSGDPHAAQFFPD